MAQQKDLIKEIESLLPQVFESDKHTARRKLAQLKKTKSKDGETSIHDLIRLKKRLHASAHQRSRRVASRPAISVDPLLPISEKRNEIIEAINNHPVVIVAGDTGSGKSTQLPKFCLEAGRGIDGKIGCTQPRRIAAITVAQRIAFELGEPPGQSVGYKIRFTDITPKDAFIKIVTDGMLLAETQNDPFLNEYDTIIIDEAHERSLNIDFMLGTLKKLLKRRKNLKLIITSATIDTEKFSNAFEAAPVIDVSGRMFPVEVRHFPGESIQEPSNEMTHIDMAIRAVDTLFQESRTGDILIFMPTEQDIRETAEMLRGRSYKKTQILPLFARLSSAEQSKIFINIADRKIIVATNIAETSITIPGIKYVIDTGLARVPHYNPRSRTTSLPVVPISRSSADQRKGRCGRVENGICIRLYDPEDFDNRPLYTPPEILRANLAEVILRMMDLNLGTISEFPFIDRPSEKSIRDGFNLLMELGAISDSPAEKDVSKKTRHPYTLTPHGRLMARIPVDPRLSRILIEAKKRHCVKDITVIISVLSIQDPRERPVDNSQEADTAHQKYVDPQSDFITLLNLWKDFHANCKKAHSASISMGQMKKYCKTNFLSFKRMREWLDIYSQISSIVKEHEHFQVPKLQKSKRLKTEQNFTPAYTAIHTSILSGFLSNIATRKDKNMFDASYNRQAMIFPGSSLFNKAGSWIVAAEMVETTRLFARTDANIDPVWLEELGGPLLKYTYHHPHWEKNRSQVVAMEQVTLFGLIISSGRLVAYGPVNATEATDIFIRNALVRLDVKEKLPFIVHNQHVIDEIEHMENKLRRKDILVSEDDVFEFYRQRLSVCYSIPMLKNLIHQNGDDRFLRMTSEDLSRYFPDEEELRLYPERVKLGTKNYNTTYTYEPGTDTDGVTVQIPSTLTGAVPAEQLDWLIPGLYKEKITALVKGLPKEFRKKLVPLPGTVDTILNEMPKADSSLITALGHFIYNRFGVDIPASAWQEESLPDHLRMRIAITDSKGKELTSSRDKSILFRHERSDIHATLSNDIKQAMAAWEKSGITQWNFGDLPDSIHLKTPKGNECVAFPGLSADPENPKHVTLRLFPGKDDALASHLCGVEALYKIHFSGELKFLKKRITVPKEIIEKTVYVGGARQFEKILFEAVTRGLFKKDIRSQKQFYDYANTVEKTILTTGGNLLNHSIQVIEAYYETRSVISSLEPKARSTRSGSSFFEQIRMELAKLVPDHFVELYDLDRFADIIRYLNAMTIRVTRALENLEKDRRKADDVAIYSDRLHELLKTLTPHTSQEKRNALEELFWMIEEYKISVFAQELKTAMPISKKRLDSKLKEIERMG